MKLIIKLILIFYTSNTFANTETFNLDLKNKTLTSQISTLSKIYNKPIIIDNLVATKRVTINAKNLDNTNAKNVISKALSLDNISIIETPIEVSFLHSKDVLKLGVEVYKNKIENPLPERMATLILDLSKDLSAVEMEKTLRQLYGRNGAMTANLKTNQLIITDWTSNLIRLQDIISKSSNSKIIN